MYLKVQLYSTKFRVPVCCLSVLNLDKFGYGCVTVLPEGTTKFSYSCLHLRISAKFRRYRYILNLVYYCTLGFDELIFFWIRFEHAGSALSA